jgi:GNAT superfamily N-acetyltransferase
MRPLRNIGIRRASREDLSAISGLASIAMRALCAPDYTPRQIEAILRFSLAANTRLIDDRTYFVIENGGEIVAAGGWSYRAALMANDCVSASDPHEIVDPATGAARLRGFFVHPHFARRGLARTLVALCERAAANAGYSHLELLTTATGRRLYLACGFVDVEWITQVYPTGVSVVMHRMGKAIEPTPGAATATRKAASATWFPVSVSIN